MIENIFGRFSRENLTRILLLVFSASLAAAVAGCNHDEATKEDPIVYSGLSKLKENTYVVVHDVKAYKQGARLAILFDNGTNDPDYKEIIVDWKGFARPNDLESICVFPTFTSAEEKLVQEILVAEAGDWFYPNNGMFDADKKIKPKFDKAQLYHLKLSGNHAAVVKAYDLPVLRDGYDDFDKNKKYGDQNEGMLCIPQKDNKVLIILGERGGPDSPVKNGALKWFWLNLENKKLEVTSLGNKGISPILPSKIDPNIYRTIGALSKCGNIIWASATKEKDGGDFHSYIYPLAKLVPSGGAPFTMVAAPDSSIKEKKKHKIEGLVSIDPGFTGICTIVAVTDDEDAGIFFKIP